MLRHRPLMGGGAVGLAGAGAPLRVAARRQSGRSGGDDIRLHKFVRDNSSAASAGSTPTVVFGGVQAAGGGGGHERMPGRGQERRGGGGGGGPSALGGGKGTLHTATAADWAAQLERELLSETDALGGLGHKDYYRDPAQGFSPQYAPRNFARGGEIAYPHGRDPTSARRRDYYEHDAAAAAASARGVRGTLRSLSSSAERAAYLSGMSRPAAHGAHLGVSASPRPVDQLYFGTGGSSIEQRRRHALVSRHQDAERTHGSGSPVLGAPAASLSELTAAASESARDANDRELEERLYMEHGLRDKERHDFTALQRRARIPFAGYDRDRQKAQREGTAYGATQLPPGTPVSSMEEAQRNLRGGGGAGAERPSIATHAQSAYLRNTASDSPKVGAALTEEVLETVRAVGGERTQRREEERKRKFGLGRQNALVQDGGPDQRVLKKHKNDERLVNALGFAANAYRKTYADEHTNPYLRRSTEDGVGHLLNNAFDVARRDDRVSRGEQDLTEREMVHYGTPVQQTIDEFVFRHRNARGERPLDYFRPFPDFRALRLYQVYQDTEGFPLMKQRPEFMEWELFVRHRAHHQQRRDLALQHGLEPAPNETAGERAQRRARLDELCERTPFDERRYMPRRHDEELAVSAETLRQCFGVYLLPSPGVTQRVLAESGTVGLHINHVADDLKTPDTREHVMSARYFNKLLLNEGFTQRIAHGSGHSLAQTPPEPALRLAQPADTLRDFTPEERVMYDEYVGEEVRRHRADWGRLARRRRYVAERGQYGEVASTAPAVEVVDVRREKDGAVLTVACRQFESELAAVAAGTAGGLSVDGAECAVVRGSRRVVEPLTVRLESGEMWETTADVFGRCPLEVDASARHNHHLDYGVAEYSYNRGNYVETQDVLWEAATAAGTEGWSPATHADSLRAGLPVRARRSFDASGARVDSAVVYPLLPSGAEDLTGGAAAAAVNATVKGDYQRARIVSYHHQPFFNPHPRTVAVRFEADGATADVPLDDVLIWQRQYYGPDRTRGDETRRYNPAGLRRYVDVADPFNERGSAAVGADGQEHFLAKYETRSARETVLNKSRSTKEIAELDQWNKFDQRRPENYRPLGISHRRDYVRQGYMHRYTPWEWIAIQEADQPVVHETIRRDDVGSSHFFSLNRYWRYKARPHGYLRNYANEVRDMLQYVDGVTPWKQAQKIRTYWEVRQHHPMPQFNRPEVAMHRNAANMLPTHLWETDKKTGKVRGVKDSVRDYQTKTPIPTWVQL